MGRRVDVRAVEGSSERMLLPAGSVDLVLTDPPYHDDVQYSELSLPLRAWALLHEGELTGEALVNRTRGQNSEAGDYEDLLTRIFKESRRTLRVDGHLIFSYANREPGAWVALFGALQEAGFRACGCELVHSENETDYAKRAVRACTLDLLIDVVPAGDLPVNQWRPQSIPETDEGAFLAEVVDEFLEVGALEPGWSQTFAEALRGTAFLSSSRSGD